MTGALPVTRVGNNVYSVGDSHIESVSDVHNISAFFDVLTSMGTYVYKKCAAIQGPLRKLVTELKY